MAELVDHLAELTGFRDRELLDVTLVSALRDLLRPRAVAIYRSVGEAGHERWLTRARLQAGELAARADPGWVDGMKTKTVTNSRAGTSGPAECDGSHGRRAGGSVLFHGPKGGRIMAP